MQMAHSDCTFGICFITFTYDAIIVCEQSVPKSEGNGKLCSADPGMSARLLSKKGGMRSQRAFLIPPRRAQHEHHHTQCHRRRHRPSERPLHGFIIRPDGFWRLVLLKYNPIGNHHRFDHFCQTRLVFSMAFPRIDQGFSNAF